jgi:hypothetical protein
MFLQGHMKDSAIRWFAPHLFFKCVVSILNKPHPVQRRTPVDVRHTGKCTER